MSEKIRLRYAPSPTGMLHIGGARTALFNYLYAKHFKGSFIVRIDDTDTKRNVEGGIESQLDNLKWLGINYDESVDKPNKKYSPYKQSEKFDLYKEYLKKLIDKNLAYNCFCSEKEIEKEKSSQSKKGIFNFMHDCPYKNKSNEELEKLQKSGKDFSVRINVEKNKDISWNDLIRGNISVNTNEIGDWVAVRNNGVPTYNFTSVIDDHLMNISHVMRGEEHITNTPKQIQLQQYFDFNIPTYAHLTLIVGEDKKKLSKRNESIIQFISQYKEMGFLPEAISNYLSLLGWSPKSEEEIFSIENLIKIFDEKGFSKSSAVFDYKKMEWYNNHYLKKLDDKSLTTFLDKFIKKDYLTKYDKTNRTKIYVLFKEQIRYGKEINDLVGIFYKPIKFNAKLKNEITINLSKKWIELISKTQKWDYDTIASLIAELKKEIKPKDIFMNTRKMITGQNHGPDLKETMVILGKERVIETLKKYN